MNPEKLIPAADAKEASGVVCDGDYLLVVSDEAPGVYFRFKISSRTNSLISISMTDEGAESKNLFESPLAIDFESIAILADGRKVALSERLRSLIGEAGLVVQYDDPLSELGDRGLEGLAVRSKENSENSQVAVLWEGGWVLSNEVLPQLREGLANPLNPVVFVHDIEKGQKEVKLRIKDDEGLAELKVPNPDENDKHGWRFRAPDLVWHTWKNGDATVDGFIVLLNSLMPSRNDGKNQFGPQWLLRFTRDGKPVGTHVDLSEVCRKLPNGAISDSANWEGLSWFEERESLVLVYDQPKGNDNPRAMVVKIPNDWR